MVTEREWEVKREKKMFTGETIKGHLKYISDSKETFYWCRVRMHA